MTSPTQALAQPSLRERANTAYEAAIDAATERADHEWEDKLYKFARRIREVLGEEIQPTSLETVIDGIPLRWCSSDHTDWIETRVYCEGCDDSFWTKVHSLEHLGILLYEPHLCDNCESNEAGADVEDIHIPDIGDVVEAINGLTEQVKQIAEHLDAFRMYGIEVRS